MIFELNKVKQKKKNQNPTTTYWLPYALLPSTPLVTFPLYAPITTFPFKTFPLHFYKTYVSKTRRKRKIQKIPQKEKRKKKHCKKFPFLSSLPLSNPILAQLPQRKYLKTPHSAELSHSFLSHSPFPLYTENTTKTRKIKRTRNQKTTTTSTLLPPLLKTLSPLLPHPIHTKNTVRIDRPTTISRAPLVWGNINNPLPKAELFMQTQHHHYCLPPWFKLQTPTSHHLTRT